ncbi:deaminase domain-containing protein, partial [Pseudomonas sp. LY10J]|uniref:deaminase domain-containing protein n=2 Tax=Pseudomonas TaxID=286 RepID=UPI0018A17883
AGDNDQARIMAQAVLGAVVAKAQGNSAATGATGAAVGELIAASIYPNTNHQDLTESERQIVSMLSTLAAGLAGGLASGDAAGGVAGAQAGQNAVENNNLSQTERIEFNQKKAEYAKGCAGAAAASPGCQTLKKELAALEDKGRSILQQEYLAVGSDMGTDTVTKNEPGSVVPCVGSSNGYCVISNTKVQTREGMEWALSPASDVQAQAQLAQNQQDSIQLDQRVREKGQEWFEGGCGGVGPGSTLCQAYFAAGGQNPFTGQVASTSERIGNAAALALGLLPFLPLGLGGASTIVRNPNLTSALTDAEAGILVERGSLGGAKATATVIDTAPMAQRVMDVRAGLPSGLRRSGNVAVAEIDIPGIPKQMAAHSQVSDAGKGLVGSGNGNFVAQSVPNKAGDLVYRGIDTEYKILDNIADQLGRNTSARGTVNILTEKAACASCLNVAEQFKAKYPNITVNILDNQGVMLRPPRKTP